MNQTIYQRQLFDWNFESLIYVYIMITNHWWHPRWLQSIKFFTGRLSFISVSNSILIKVWQMADAEFNRIFFKRIQNMYFTQKYDGSSRNICRKCKLNTQQRPFATTKLTRFPGPMGRGSSLSTMWPSGSTCLYSNINFEGST